MPVTMGMIFDHALITKYSYWDSFLKRQNLDPEKAPWEHPHICLFELLFCSSR